jgi:uncharacterized protein (TIGR03000 family)
MSQPSRSRFLTLLAVTFVASLLLASDAGACWHLRCRVCCHRQKCYYYVWTPSQPNQQADADEAQFGKDIPKPTPPQDVPTVPSLEEMLRKADLNDDAGRAGLVVKLPRDARLFLEDEPTLPQDDQSSRLFITPPMKDGQAHLYHVRGEVVRDGTILSVTRKVEIRAGEVVLVDLADLTTDQKAPVASAGLEVASQ